MPFSNQTQPGVTRYPNLLPVQAEGYPDGTFLAMLAKMDRTAYERVVRDGVKAYNKTLLEQIQAYEDGLGVKRVAEQSKRLALYLLKRPQLWVQQKQIFPKKCDRDWQDFSILVWHCCVEGKFDDEGTFNKPLVEAIWRQAAMSLGVMVTPEQQFSEAAA